MIKTLHSAIRSILRDNNIITCSCTKLLQSIPEEKRQEAFALLTSNSLAGYHIHVYGEPAMCAISKKWLLPDSKKQIFKLAFSLDNMCSVLTQWLNSKCKPSKTIAISKSDIETDFVAEYVPIVLSFLDVLSTPEYTILKQYSDTETIYLLTKTDSFSVTASNNVDRLRNWLLSKHLLLGENLILTPQEITSAFGENATPFLSLLHNSSVPSFSSQAIKDATKTTVVGYHICRTIV